MLLSDVRVLECTEGLAGAYCARLLADFGAEVIKIEPPGGDPARGAEPRTPDGESVLFAYVNHGKRVVALDLAQAQGMALFDRLLERVDILVLAPPAGSPALAERAAPAHVVVSLSAFGLEGTMANTPASDLTIAHRSGFAYHHARPVAEPETTPPSGGADREAALATGLVGAVAAVSHLFGRDDEASATHADVAQSDVLAWLLVDSFIEYSKGERAFARRRDEHSGTTVAGGSVFCLPCTDGWVVVSPREQHQWDRWVEVLENPAWARDAALCGTFHARKDRARELQRLMSEWTRVRTKRDVVARAQGARIACFPVSTAADLLENPQLEARAFFDRFVSQGGHEVLVPGLPFAVRTSNGTQLERGRIVRTPALGGPA